MKKILHFLKTKPFVSILSPTLFVFMLFKSILLQSFFEGLNHYVPSLFEDGVKLLLGIIFGFFSLLLLCSPIFLFKKGKTRFIYLLTLDILLTIFCIIDVCYFRAFPEMFSFSAFSLAGDAAQEGYLSLKIILGLFSGFDLFFFADYLLLAALLFFRRFYKDTEEHPTEKQGVRARQKTKECPHFALKLKIFFSKLLSHRAGRFTTALLSSLLFLFFIPLLHLTGNAEDTFYKIYDPPFKRDTACYFTPLGYHLYDIGNEIAYAVRTYGDNAATTHPLSTVILPTDTGPFTTIDQTTDSPPISREEAQINAFYDYRASIQKNSYFSGMFKGKNILLLQVESLEHFVLNNEFAGKEITPNLNKLLGSTSSSIVFTGIHDQVKSGNSSDCDYMINTGLLPTASVFFKNHLNKQPPTIPQLLRDMGYNTIHINGSGDKCVWDYSTAYRDVFGFHTEKEDPLRNFFLLTAPKNDRINNYMSDEKILAFLYDRLEEIDRSSPFYMHTILCSSHMPFVGIYDALSEDELLYTPTDDEKDNKTYAYLNCVHYVDAMIGAFLEKAEKEGLLENTIVLIYGDHQGLHKYYPKDAESAVKAHKELAFIEEEADAALAFILYDPTATISHFYNSTFGGQVDIMPTVLDLLGVPYEDYSFVMGRSLISSDADYVLLPSGKLLSKAPLTSKVNNIIMRMYNTANLIITTDYFKDK